jgi:magnesium transporter
MQALDNGYLETSFGNMFRKRAGWLSAIGFFEREITQVVMLAFFIPLIISSGGNSGAQAATLVIRAMALGEVHPRHWWRVLRREALCGIGLGAALCAIGMTRILLWHEVSGAYGERSARLALTVGASLIGVVLFGTLIGAMLPLILRACRLDPASASAPAVATVVDVSGLVIYFSVAKAIIL